MANVLNCMFKIEIDLNCINLFVSCLQKWSPTMSLPE
jgi:hypothetical protein